MAMLRRSLPTLAALAIALLAGRITDKTTGQPLAGVRVRATGAYATRTAVTDRHGRYAIPGLHPGRYRIRISSNDVPPQTFHVTVGRAPRKYDITACSTTLDYECDPGSPFGGG